MTKPCDACQSGNAVIYCRADTAYLCSSCDNKVHAANKLASRHERVLVCEVCEHAPAAVTCKADAAALCVTCDNDIHSANPLARRHERVPVIPFYDPPTGGFGKFVHGERGHVDEEQQCSLLLKEDEDEEEEESSAAEAASWLLPHPMKISAEAEVKESNEDECKDAYVENNNSNTFYTCPKPSNKSIKSQQNFDLFSDMDPYLDMDFVSALGAVTDSLVPIHGTEVLGDSPIQSNEEESYDLKPHSFCPDLSLSTSSVDVGVVPDASLSDISTPQSKIMEYPQRPTHATPLEPMAREARVLRYREKRKNRKFEKTIRYASRKAYAETRPRIKGRFAKRSEMDMEQMYAIVPDAFGVVPSF